MVASSGATLLEDDAVGALVARLFPLATVVTPNLLEAVALAGARRRRGRELAERLHELGAAAVIVTGGHGEPPVDHLFDGTRHVEIPVDAPRRRARRTAPAARTRRRSRRCSPAGCRSRRRRAAPPRRPAAAVGHGLARDRRRATGRSTSST